MALGGAGGYALGNAAADGTDQVGLVGNGKGGGQSRLPGTPPGVRNGTGVLRPGQDRGFDDDFDGSHGGANGANGGTDGGNGTNT